MLFWLLYQVLFLGMAKDYPFLSPLRVFQYVTTRTAFASLTALFLSVMLGPWLIRKLREFQIGQHIREEGPRSHQKKAGTPTMGGVLTIISIVVPTLLFADLRNPYVWVALFALLVFGLIGFHDDYAKVRKKQNLGLTAKQKFAAQAMATLAIGIMLLGLHARGAYDTAMNVPFFKQFRPDLLVSALL
ncbi:MAG TPA: phospho-N-acetylmuramoyl-pentapeptide-transferase, partial [Bryobacteraceae bacterium]|nr:phospho-N-acetylmuramoyl-pentapeptide-transferase [Bryobacteraceae bacterium]